MRRHWQYLKYVLRHKWFVLVAGIKIGVPIHLLILHDMSKFRPFEWFAYARTFHAPDGTGQYKLDGTGFDVAWLHHQNHNKHHWQYWLLSEDNPDPEFNMQSHDGGMTHNYIVHRSLADVVAIVYDATITDWHNPPNEMINDLKQALQNTPTAMPMPNRYRDEMLADWIGAGRALGKPDTRAWYHANRDKIILHPDTQAHFDWVFAYSSETLEVITNDHTTE